MLITYTAESLDWVSIDDEPTIPRPEKRDQLQKLRKGRNRVEQKPETSDNQEEPTKLPNGKWACNHKCKDKTM